MLGTFAVILRISIRNLFANGINLVIGGIMLFGTLLVVVGSSLLDSVDYSMSKSIIGSIAGHLQVYSAKSKDELALYGNFGGDPDLNPMSHFAQVKTALTSDANVKYVVPMGISNALITSGNTVDLTLAELRDVVREEKGRTPDLAVREESLKAHVRQIVEVIKGDLKNLQEIVQDTEREKESKAILERASSEAFWRDFDKDPYASLEFLENQVAPQVTDADLLQIRYVGTDLDTYQKAFDRMEIVDGQMVPSGHRGFLFSKFVYEENLKLKTALRLDKIKNTLETSRGRQTLANDPTLQRYVKENQAQTREILFQLDAIKTHKAVAILQKALGQPINEQAPLEPLLVSFLDTNDANFNQRYDVFYKELAPLLQLYRLRIGDTLTIKAFTRSGYMQSVNVKIFGTYRFKGMGEAPLAGAISLMDLMSFRDLYGYLSSESVAEIKALQKEAGAKEVDRAKAEDELFGSDRRVVEEAHASPQLEQEADAVKGAAKSREEAALRQTFTQADIDNGVVLNAAVILKDPTKLKRTEKEISAINDRQNLGLKLMSWQSAAGILGQMVLLLRLVLYFAVFIIFVVALVIINNAMMMATLQRVHEIGTMRAVGAQRSFVLGMVLTETIALGLVFGGAGALLGSGLMALLRHVGIPAGGNDVVRFFFSGTRLYPLLGAVNVVAAFVIVLVVSLISTLYPAITATRVSPVRAMQSDE